PHVGVDDILHVVLSQRRDEDFDHAQAQARIRLARLSKDPVMNDDAVRTVVREYFAAVEYSILTHSSWMRVFFLLSRYLAGQLAGSFVNRLAAGQALQVVAGARVFHEAEMGLQAWPPVTEVRPPVSRLRAAACCAPLRCALHDTRPV